MNDIALNVEPPEADVNENLFRLVQEITKDCNQRHPRISQIQNLIEKNRILQDLELLQPSRDEHGDELNETYRTILETTLLKKCLEKCKNDSDRLFFSAATFKFDELERIINNYHDPDFVNQAKRSDSVITFALKYGNIANENFLKCMEFLIDKGVDLNKCDFSGKFAIDYVAILYRYQGNRDNLEKLVSKFLKKELCPSEENETKDFMKRLNLNFTCEGMDNQHKLFYWIAKNKTKNFLDFRNIARYVNCDNGENTLLQYASKRSNQDIAKFLLKNSANPNQTVKFNTSALYKIFIKNQAIFKDVVEHDFKITSEIFNILLTRHSKYFKILLQCDKLNAGLRQEGTGNMPLHYAIIYNQKAAIVNILKRSPWTLNEPNNSGKTPLDMINGRDLETYFNTCLALDTYNTNFYSDDYKMHLRFRSLIIIDNNDKVDETKVILKIAGNKNLHHVLLHPLICTFVNLKWLKVKLYYWIILLIQALIFLSLGTSLFYFTESITALALSIVIIFINVILKAFIVFGNIKSLFLTPKMHYAHGELFLLLLVLLSYAFPVCRVLVFVTMALIFLLNAGYHPKIAKWSVMFQTVFKTFLVLLLFFSVIILAFAVSFHMLFRESDHQFFGSLWKSFFITYVMTTGEFNTGDVKFAPGQFVQYLIFLMFAMFLSLFAVNFFIGATVTDMDKIEKDAEINAMKNVIKFLNFVQTYVYSKNVLRKFLPLSMLFSEKLEDQNYDAHFYVNRKKQFEGQNKFPDKMGEECMEKIEQFYLHMQMKTN